MFSSLLDSSDPEDTHEGFRASTSSATSSVTMATPPSSSSNHHHHHAGISISFPDDDEEGDEDLPLSATSSASLSASGASSLSAFRVSGKAGMNNTKETKGDFSMHMFSRQGSKHQTVQLSFFVNRIPKIDSDKGTFDADFKLILKYQHKPLKDVPSGEWWMPDLFFSNVVEFEEKMDPEFVYDNETHELTLTKHFMATFSFDMDLARFPFDSQILSINVRSFMCRLQRKDARVHSAKSKEWRFGKCALHSISDESDDSSSIAMEIPVSRRPRFYIVYIVLPLFLITSTSWSSFFIVSGSYDTRLVITTLSFLSVVMFRSATTPLLPRISYMNDMGNYFLVCYFFLFLVEIMNLTVSNPQMPEDTYALVNHIMSLFSFALFVTITTYFCAKSFFRAHVFKTQWLR